MSGENIPIRGERETAQRRMRSRFFDRDECATLKRYRRLAYGRPASRIL
jgi:hypothetical protein